MSFTLRFRPRPVLQSIHANFSSYSKTVIEDSPIGSPRKNKWYNYKFVDKLTIEVKGGRGGNGCMSTEGLVS